MNKVRFGLIGCGGMARNHLRYFDAVEGLEFVAAADPEPANLNTVRESHGVTVVEDGHELIRSGEVDAVLIATPHYFHPQYAISAFENGVHALVEKPVAVTAKAAAEVNTAYEKAKREHPGLLYAAMFNQRTNPCWMTVKRLINEGRVGRLVRASWTITSWFRSQSYYDSGGWRATWKGEGGGVLLNQCPHNLDLFQWFVGMPSSLIATAELGKHHEIEVEDEVSALLQYPNGATGTFIASTAQTPGINRLEIVGDRGTIIAEDGDRITFLENQTPALEHLRTTHEHFGTPPVTRYEITPAKAPVGEHQSITANFIAAILRHEPLIAPGVAGINGLELGNAMLQSGLEGSRKIELPTDREAYHAMLRELIANSSK